MDNYLWFNNSNRRTAIDEDYVTTKFKTVYPTYQIWQDALTTYGIPVNNIIESEFMFLQSMIGNAWLKYTTDVKNSGYIAFKFKELWFKRERTLKLTEVELADSLKATNTNLQTLYDFGGIEDDMSEILKPEFLNAKSKNESSTNIPIIDRLKQIKEFNNIKPADLTFLSELATVIVLPYQPNQGGQRW